jgi:glutaredoxin
MSSCKFIIYGRDGCGYTKIARDHMENYNLSHEYRDESTIEKSHENQLQPYNHRTVPKIFLQCTRNSYFIGGCNEFLSLLRIFGLIK